MSVVSSRGGGCGRTPPQCWAASRVETLCALPHRGHDSKIHLPAAGRERQPQTKAKVGWISSGRVQLCSQKRIGLLCFDAAAVHSQLRNQREAAAAEAAARSQGMHGVAGAAQRPLEEVFTNCITESVQEWAEEAAEAVKPLRVAMPSAEAYNAAHGASGLPEGLAALFVTLGPAEAACIHKRSIVDHEVARAGASLLGHLAAVRAGSPSTKAVQAWATHALSIARAVEQAARPAMCTVYEPLNSLLPVLVVSAAGSRDSEHIRTCPLVTGVTASALGPRWAAPDKLLIHPHPPPFQTWSEAYEDLMGHTGQAKIIQAHLASRGVPPPHCWTGAVQAIREAQAKPHSQGLQGAQPGNAAAAVRASSGAESCLQSAWTPEALAGAGRLAMGKLRALLRCLDSVQGTDSVCQGEAWLHPTGKQCTLTVSTSWHRQFVAEPCVGTPVLTPVTTAVVEFGVQGKPTIDGEDVRTASRTTPSTKSSASRQSSKSQAGQGSGTFEAPGSQHSPQPSSQECYPRVSVVGQPVRLQLIPQLAPLPPAVGPVRPPSNDSANAVAADWHALLRGVPQPSLASAQGSASQAQRSPATTLGVRATVSPYPPFHSGVSSHVNSWAASPASGGTHSAAAPLTAWQAQVPSLWRDTALHRGSALSTQPSSASMSGLEPPLALPGRPALPPQSMGPPTGRSRSLDTAQSSPTEGFSQAQRE